MGGGGVKKSQILAYVLYGWSLRVKVQIFGVLGTSCHVLSALKCALKSKNLDETYYSCINIYSWPLSLSQKNAAIDPRKDAIGSMIIVH